MQIKLITFTCTLTLRNAISTIVFLSDCIDLKLQMRQNNKPDAHFQFDLKIIHCLTFLYKLSPLKQVKIQGTFLL